MSEIFAVGCRALLKSSAKGCIHGTCMSDQVQLGCSGAVHLPPAVVCARCALLQMQVSRVGLERGSSKCSLGAENDTIY